MLTLTLFPQRFLISMGIGGAATALVSCAAALLAVPALMVLLAGRIGKAKPAPEGTGRWYKLAQAVMRRPALVAVGTTLALLVIASPTLHVHWTGVDATDLPSGQSARVVSDMLGREFAAQELNPIEIAVRAPAVGGPAHRCLRASAQRGARGDRREFSAIPGQRYVGHPARRHRRSDLGAVAADGRADSRAPALLRRRLSAVRPRRSSTRRRR